MVKHAADVIPLCLGQLKVYTAVTDVRHLSHVAWHSSATVTIMGPLRPSQITAMLFT